MARLRWRWAGPLAAVALTAGAATGIAQLSDNFSNPVAPVPGHGLLTYLTMTGTKTGEFTGGATQKGHHGAIAVLGLDVGLIVTTSQSSGVPTGKAVCNGLNFRKPTDRATPQLFRAAATGEVITGAVFNEYQTSANGTQQLALQIKLTNSLISSIHHVNARTTGAYDDLILMPAAVTVAWKPTNTVTQYSCHSAA